MKRHLNTLYVMTEGSYLAKDGEAVAVRVEKETRLRVPIHNLGGIVCFGNVGCSPYLLGFCGRNALAATKFGKVWSEAMRTECAARTRPPEPRTGFDDKAQGQRAKRAQPWVKRRPHALPRMGLYTFC
jgi:hypothetical protein